MSQPRITLSGIVVQGHSVADAGVQFYSPSTLITGPSDTGKSYILQCIDYCLGAGTAPKRIPQSRPYELVSLTLRMPSQRVITLRRALRGGDVEMLGGPPESAEGSSGRTLAARHAHDDPSSLSGYLLHELGLHGGRLRKAKSGKTVSFSMRHFAHLAILDEDHIFSSDSPVWVNNRAYAAKTENGAAFRFLLTGVDDREVVAGESSTERRLSQAAQADILDSLLSQFRSKIEDLGIEADLDAEVQRIEAEMASREQRQSADHEALRDAETERETVWNAWKERKSKLQGTRSLISRFALLEEHYASDIARLEAVLEAGALLEQTPSIRCPLCGSAVTGGQLKSCGHDVVEIQEAHQREREKIVLLSADLRRTLADLRQTETTLSREEAELQAQHEALSRDIERVLRPAAQSSMADFKALAQRRQLLERALTLREQIDLLQERKDHPPQRQPTRTAPNAVQGTTADETSGLCRTIEALLGEWRFPGDRRVEFSEADQDILVGGVQRSSHGKGYRALLRSAFAIGLMRHCVENALPHPGFVVVDSPLVAYREPGEAENAQLVGSGVREAFFESLSRKDAPGQVVVLENVEPAADLTQIQHVRFTKDCDHGRYGFFPIGA